MGAGGIWEISLPSAKTALKNKVYYKIINTMTNVWI